YMTAWAGNSDGMFGKAIADTQTTLQHAREVLAHEPRGTVVIYSVHTELPGPIGGGPGGGMRPAMLGYLQVLADVTIDDNNLTFSVTNPRSTWFDTAHLDDNVVAGRATIWTGRIQGEINSINSVQARLGKLQEHEAALQQMIAALQAWR